MCSSVYSWISLSFCPCPPIVFFDFPPCPTSLNIVLYPSHWQPPLTVPQQERQPKCIHCDDLQEGSHTKCGNYRGISLLSRVSVAGKIRRAFILQAKPVDSGNETLQRPTETGGYKRWTFSETMDFFRQS